jgi:large subunit ribosomal protein L13
MIKQSTYTITKAEMADIKKWYVVDATDMVVGRMASEIAKILRGKNKPQFTTHNDAGDFVIVINAEKVKFTGDKWNQKVYNWHTNHIGGIKARTAKVQLEKHPEAIVEEAVRGMLGKNTLGRAQFTKLKVFVGPTHTHEAQKPETLKFDI